MQAVANNIADTQLQEDLDGVREVIEELIIDTPEMIRGMIHKLMSGSGKMLRPMLVIIAGRYGTFDKDRIYSMAAAVELLHNATLVHDDIIDDAPIRRGSPSIHTLHGSKLAILVGDYLFSTCFLVAANNSNIDNYNRLALAVARICEGEILQDTGKYTFDPSIRNYKRRIASKTAVLFSMSLYLGAKESGCSEEDCSLFVRIGYNLGMAFQIIDDILDFKGQPEKTGKPSFGHDIKEGVFTLPVILGLQKDNEKLRSLLHKKPYNKRTIKKIITIVKESDSVNEAAQEASRYTDRALRELDRLQEGYTRDQLCVLTKRLLKRDY